MESRPRSRYGFSSWGNSFMQLLSYGDGSRKTSRTETAARRFRSNSIIFLCLPFLSFLEVQQTTAFDFYAFYQPSKYFFRKLAQKISKQTPLYKWKKYIKQIQKWDFFAWSGTSLTLLKPPRWFRFLVGPEWRRFGVKGFCLGCGWQHTPPQMLSVN